MATRFKPVRSILTLAQATALLLPLMAAPAAAQYAVGADNPKPAAAATPAPAEQKPAQLNDGAAPEDDGVTVIAPRAVQPDYQAVDEYHKAEFARLDAIYGKPPPPEPQGDAAFDTGGTMTNPADRSDVRDAIRNAPRIRDTLKSE